MSVNGPAKSIWICLVNGLVKSIWIGLVIGRVNGLVKSIWIGPVNGLVKPFYILFTVDIVFHNICIQSTLFMELYLQVIYGWIFRRFTTAAHWIAATTTIRRTTTTQPASAVKSNPAEWRRAVWQKKKIAKNAQTSTNSNSETKYKVHASQIIDFAGISQYLNTI